MDFATIGRYGKQLEHVTEASISWLTDKAIQALLDNKDYDLIGALLLICSEISARQLVKALLSAEVYEPLALAACLRRQQRKFADTGGGGGGTAKRIFRDFEAEDNVEGIPDHIRAEAEDITRAADATRMMAVRRDAEFDRDPMRDYIVAQVAEKLPTATGALEALVVTAKCSVWEETRRSAAMKVATHDLSVRRLAAALRTEDLIAVADAATLSAIANKVAVSFTYHWDQIVEKGDWTAATYIAEHHPDEGWRKAAQAAIPQA